MSADRRSRHSSYEMAVSGKGKDINKKGLTTTETLEEISGEADIIDMDQSVKKSLDDKLIAIVQSMNKIHVKYDIITDAVCHETEGLEAKVAVTQSNVEDVTTQIHEIIPEIRQEEETMFVVKGLLQKHEQEIEMLKGKINVLAAKSTKEQCDC